LGVKYLVVLCAGSTLLLVQSKALDEAPYKLSRAVAKLAGFTFLSLAFSYWTDKPWFLTKGKLMLCLSYLPLGVPNWSVIYISIPSASSCFLAPLPGRKKTSARGVLNAHPLLCFSFALLYFYLHHFIKNTQKLVSFIVAFIYLPLVLLE
jgi:hypothetical protein